MQLNRKKPVACMLELIRQNIWCFLGAMLGTVMMVLISFATPVLLAETVDSVLGTVPSTLPDWLLQPIRALGGRAFLRENLWIMGAILVGLNLLNGVFTFFKGLTTESSKTATFKRNRKRHGYTLSTAYRRFLQRKVSWFGTKWFR